MKSLYLNSLFILLLAAPWSATAQVSTQTKRQISLELEEVEDASQYEIELVSKNSGQSSLFKMKKPIWKAKIAPGEYKLRLRSYDSRGVPGVWSEESVFLVKLPGPELVSPAKDAQIKTNEEDKYETHFEWKALAGITKYRITIVPEGGETISDTVSGSSTKMKLPVAKSYQWTVAAITKAGEVGDTQDESSPFTLVGAPIEPVEIETPEDIWVQNVKWQQSEHAKYFNYLLQRKDEKGGWQKLEAKENYGDLSVAVAQSYPGGRFRLAVKAFAEKREPSKIVTKEFEVFAGDRSPAAVEESKLRYSLEKPTPWYFVASYLITNIKYEAENPFAGNGAHVSYDALGGTGRLGLGYINPKKDSGYLGIVDLSGATVNDKNITYAAAEVHYVKRYTWGRNMLRPSVGLFYKEIYESQTYPPPGARVEQGKITFIGPHIGFDLWRPLSPKYGIQLNARVYNGVIGVKSPNGKDQDPELSYQIGFMGSYKLAQNVTGFMGWAHREDKATYASTTQAEDPTSQAQGDAKQSVTIKGDFLNFLLEWAF